MCAFFDNKTIKEIKEMSASVTIDGVKYVREDSIIQKAVNTEGLPAAIVRSPSAGVFAGYLAEYKDRSVKLLGCRRIWYWSGAFTLSEMSKDGVSKPNDCKFSDTVDEHYILDASEIIPMTQKSANQIFSIPPMK